MRARLSKGKLAERPGTHLRVCGKHRDRRTHTHPGRYWALPERRPPHSRVCPEVDRRVSRPLVHVLDDLKKHALDRDINGIASIVQLSDGQFEILIAGETMKDPHVAAAGLLSLQKAISNLIDIALPVPGEEG